MGEFDAGGANVLQTPKIHVLNLFESNWSPLNDFCPELCAKCAFKYSAGIDAKS